MLIQRLLPVSHIRLQCLCGFLLPGSNTHHFAGYAHLVKLLLVVLAGFGAVVGHKDKLLACHHVSTKLTAFCIGTSLPLLLNISSVSAVPGKR